ncbi:hypothetical protein AAZX31_07G220500 [Glycine max]|nr:hypothetical protein GLYMA_07G238550v4 [Glycine max]
MLNRDGCVTLAKSVLNSIPVYSMQNFWLPEGVCESIDRITRSFIWGSQHSHWVTRETVTKPMTQRGLGVRTARNTNTSLLGKHVWSLLHHQTKPWVALLSHKYLQHGSIFLSREYKRCSYTWLSITKAAELLEPGFRFRVGTGDMPVWYDRWNPNGFLCDMVDYVNIQDFNLTLKDVYENGMWLWNNMATIIPSQVPQEFNSLFLNSTIADTVIWSAAQNHVFMAKTAYWWLQSQANVSLGAQAENNSWMWLMKIPQNIKFFLWLTSHKSLPTKFFLVYRHLSSNPFCCRCSNQVESVLHLLRDCDKACSVWSMFQPTLVVDFAEHDSSVWLHKHATCATGALFCLICWFIWRDRNAMTFSNENWQEWFIASQVNNMLNIISNQQECQPRNRYTVQVAWKPPPPTVLKLNTDGSSLVNPGQSGFGGVIRDSQRDWIIGYTGSCGVTTSLQAELFALA